MAHVNRSVFITFVKEMERVCHSVAATHAEECHNIACIYMSRNGKFAMAFHN